MADAQENGALQISYRIQFAAGNADGDAVTIFNEIEIANRFASQFFDPLKELVSFICHQSFSQSEVEKQLYYELASKCKPLSCKDYLPVRILQLL